MLPLIGIVTGLDHNDGRLSVHGAHLEIIGSMGGVPAVFGVYQSPRDILEHIHGLLLVEGPDVHPMFYGEDPSPGLMDVDTERDEFEIKLVRMAVDMGLPVLGIDRGMHVINVALGGTLYQDLSEIPKAVKHDWNLASVNPSQRLHKIRLKTKSMLYDILKSSIQIQSTNEVYLGVNSFHHQAIKRVGDGLKPVAYAVDGLIEAIEGNGAFVLGVQWHPEYLHEMKKIYGAFLRAAVEYMTKKLELQRIEIEAAVRDELREKQDETHHSSETTDNPPDTSQT